MQIDIEKLADEFFEWDGPRTPVVTLVSAKLFARHVADQEAASLRTEVEQLKLAEEGAAEAFGVVVQDKRDLEAEVRRLTSLLHGCHDTIRTLSRQITEGK